MADNTNRLGGIAFFTIDGQAYALRGDLKYTPATISREGVVGQDGPHGYKETPVYPTMSLTLSDTGGLTVADFNEITNSTLVAQLANGKVVTGRNAFTVETQEVDTVEAKFEVKFNCFAVTEQLP
jgi:hypothetical protein